MKQHKQSRRFNHLAREKLASILMFELGDPVLSQIVISDCEVAVDKSLAHVYVSCDKDLYDEVMEALRRAKPYIRKLLGHALSWRTTPELVFHIDHTVDEAYAITEALKNVPPSLAIPKDEHGYPIENAPVPLDEADEKLKETANVTPEALAPAPDAPDTSNETLL